MQPTAVFLFCLALCQLSVAHFICNQKTQFECSCDDDCWDLTSSRDNIDWLSIHLLECPPTSLKEDVVRKKVAGWINEECGASLNCHLTEGLEGNNIVIGDYSCQKKEIRLLVLRNSTADIYLENTLPATIVGQVLHSREHLLSFLLHSELMEVSVFRKLAGHPINSRRSPKFWMVVFSCLFALFLLFLLLLVYCSQIYINWKRIVKGKWQSKDYSKVPNVRYSVDEIETNGHI